MADQTEKNLNEEIRASLDEQIQQIKKLGSSRERSIAITRIEEAVFWLEKDLRNKVDPEGQHEPEEFINPEPTTKR